MKNVSSHPMETQFDENDLIQNLDSYVIRSSTSIKSTNNNDFFQELKNTSSFEKSETKYQANLENKYTNYQPTNNI